MFQIGNECSSVMRIHSFYDFFFCIFSYFSSAVNIGCCLCFHRYLFMIEMYEVRKTVEEISHKVLLKKIKRNNS
jgi:hypothetical protein